jgi:UDP-N-acetylglucosamine 2-epimerase
MTVVGTRPNIIKTSIVSKKIRENHEEILVDTGQHYDDALRDVFFREMDIPDPTYTLGVGSGSHGKQTGEILSRLEEVVLMERPDLVVVYGDTNSTIGGALVASKLHIPVMHIEAGVRSYDRRMPEEINRVVVDHLSDILCCPTPGAFRNLNAEGIGNNPRGWVSVTGDIMYDLWLKYGDISLKRSNIIDHFGLHPKKYYVATIHRPSNTDDKNALKGILSAFEKISERIIFPLHPRTRSAMLRFGLELPENVTGIAPVGYFDMLTLIRFAKKVLTDSGGLQKESYFIGTPCITMRDTTEWGETLCGYWNICVGNNPMDIIGAVAITPDKERINLDKFGTGNATYEIVEYINRMSRLVDGCSNGYH